MKYKGGKTMKIRIICIENGIVYYQMSEDGKFYPSNTVDIKNPNRSTPFYMHEIDTFIECVKRWKAYVTNPSKLKPFMRPVVTSPNRPSYSDFIKVNGKNQQ